MPNKIQAVIFDIDGTLIDSVDMHTDAWQKAFEFFDKKIPFHEIRSQIGKGGDQLMPVFLSKEELGAIGESIEKYRSELWKENYLTMVKPFPMVKELFERIIKDDKQIALASSAKEDELSTYKSVTGITDLVRTSTSSDDAKRSKPYPDIFEAALSRLGELLPENVIVVGDSPYDAIAAKKARMDTVGVLCGGFSEQVLQEAGCIAIYNDPADLLTHYESSPIAR